MKLGQDLMVIDVHQHPVRKILSTKNYSEMFKKLGFSEESIFFSPLKNVRQFERTDLQDPLQAHLFYMEMVDVKYAILSGDNNLVLEWVTKHPDKFVPFYLPTIPPPDAESLSKSLDSAISQSFKGVGELLLPLFGMSLNDERMFPLYARAEQLGIVVEFHTGGNVPYPKLFGYPEFKILGANPLLLEKVVTEFPALKVVLCHMGYPFANEANHMAFTYPNVYIEISCANFGKQLYNLLRNAMDMAGTDKLLFGSDAASRPYMIPYAVNNVKNLDFLSKKEKNMILEENAGRLIPAPERPSKAM